VISALDGGDRSTSRSCLFTPGKEPSVPIGHEAVSFQEPVWNHKSLSYTRNRNRDVQCVVQLTYVTLELWCLYRSFLITAPSLVVLCSVYLFCRSTADELKRKGSAELAVGHLRWWSLLVSQHVTWPHFIRHWKNCNFILFVPVEGKRSINVRIWDTTRDSRVLPCVPSVCGRVTYRFVWPSDGNRLLMYLKKITPNFCNCQDRNFSARPS
jgi:hypothetical protein